MFDDEEIALLRAVAASSAVFITGLTERQKYIAYALVDRGLASYDVALRMSAAGTDAIANMG